MRTIVTIDPDAEALFKAKISRTGNSFKAVLNQAVKQALGRSSAPIQEKPLFKKPFPAELEDANFNHLAHAWEDDNRKINRPLT